MIKNPLANARDTGWIPRLGRSSGEANGNHSSILAWKIPWTEGPGGLQPVGSQSQIQLSNLTTNLNISYLCLLVYK